MEHVNVYGPQASGKTRNAERLRLHYNCKTVIDRAGSMNREIIIRADMGRCLILTQELIRLNGLLRNVRIDVALAEMEGARHGRE